MRLGFRHCDHRMPFLWQSAAQPAARWHGAGDGPANYFADTPVGAWAEFLRHEEITDPADLAGVRRSLWVVELPDERSAPVARNGRVWVLFGPCASVGWPAVVAGAPPASVLPLVRYFPPA